MCFRNAARLLRFRPENGKAFRARGRLTTYDSRGEYQLVVEVLEPAGLGALQLHAYQDAIARGGLATMRGYRKTHDDDIRGTVISRLLCHAVVNMAQIGREFGIDFRSYFGPELQRLEEHRADRLITYDGDDLRVTPLGRIFIRNVAMVFDPYLERQPTDKPLFSKTL